MTFGQLYGSSTLPKTFSRLRIWLSFYQHLRKLEEQNKFLQKCSFFQMQSSIWSRTLMVWAFIEIAHGQWSNIVLREKRQWLIRHAETGSVVRLRCLTSVGCILSNRTNSCNKMHRLRLFQSELKGLAHFSFQGGICNLISAFAWRVKTRVGMMASWKNCLQSRPAYSELFSVWPHMGREW